MKRIASLGLTAIALITTASASGCQSMQYGHLHVSRSDERVYVSMGTPHTVNEGGFRSPDEITYVKTKRIVAIVAATGTTQTVSKVPKSPDAKFRTAQERARNGRSESSSSRWIRGTRKFYRLALRPQSHDRFGTLRVDLRVTTYLETEEVSELRPWIDLIASPEETIVAPIITDDKSALCALIKAGGVRCWDAKTGFETGRTLVGEKTQVLALLEDNTMLVARSLPKVSQQAAELLIVDSRTAEVRRRTDIELRMVNPRWRTFPGDLVVIDVGHLVAIEARALRSTKLENPESRDGSRSGIVVGDRAYFDSESFVMIWDGGAQSWQRVVKPSKAPLMGVLPSGTLVFLSVYRDKLPVTVTFQDPSTGRVWRSRVDE